MQPRRKRVLLVDDDPQILESLEYALTQKGYEVILAHDGREGLMRAERDAPDLIVLDMLMPRRSGMLVLDHLKSRPGIRARIMMVTANDDAKHREFAASRGVDAFLAKPYDLEELLKVVEELVPLDESASNSQDS